MTSEQRASNALSCLVLSWVDGRSRLAATLDSCRAEGCFDDGQVDVVKVAVAVAVLVCCRLWCS